MRDKIHGPTTAIWAITPNGARIARIIAENIEGSFLFLSEKLADASRQETGFTRLKPAVQENFRRFTGHIFIMATGIVVRTIATQLVHKTSDPAVVVCDEAGQFAISLASGHVGGANDLSKKVARIIGGIPVITTATDVNRLPAIDLIAKSERLTIENPDAIKSVNMAILTGRPLVAHDPFELVLPHLSDVEVSIGGADRFESNRAGIFVDHVCLDLPPEVLILRPGSLVAGMGCNRGTETEEMRELLVRTLADNDLCISSLRALATVDVKTDEPGLLALAESMNIPLQIFDRTRLGQVKEVPNPSVMVEKHIGVKSVCEAAALLATHRGHLIVDKRKTANATVAIAADGYTSSASDRADRNT